MRIKKITTELPELFTFLCKVPDSVFFMYYIRWVINREITHLIVNESCKNYFLVLFLVGEKSVETIDLFYFLYGWKAKVEKMPHLSKISEYLVWVYEAKVHSERHINRVLGNKSLPE